MSHPTVDQASKQNIGDSEFVNLVVLMTWARYSSRIVFVRFLEELKTPKRHFEINWTLESVPPPPPLQFFGPSAVPELTMLDVGSPSRFTEEYWLFYSIEKPKTLYVAALKSNFDWIWSVWKWLFIQNYNNRIVKKKKVCLVPFLYSYYLITFWMCLIFLFIIEIYL